MTAQVIPMPWVRAGNGDGGPWTLLAFRDDLGPVRPAEELTDAIGALSTALYRFHDLPGSATAVERARALATLEAVAARVVGLTLEGGVVL